jgi:peptidoglycan/xylan/chitin deacetylase (PgdA/CDA1 family)
MVRQPMAPVPRLLPPLILALTALVLLPLQPRSSASAIKREVAITFDDLPGVSAVDGSAAHLRRVTTGLLRTFGRRRIPVVGFVNEGKLWQNGSIDEERVALLREWLTAGLELGNHTYSHVDLHAAPLDEVKDAVVRGDATMRVLMASQRRAPRYFRHPYLRTGRDPETRQSLQAFLAERGYRVAPVTIDNADYIFAAAYDRSAARGDDRTADEIVTMYLDYMSRVLRYYEDQSQALFGREIRQVLLLHANALNALAFDRLAATLESRGYAFIHLDRALQDAAYTSDDTYFGPGGISWIHRWAISQGKQPEFFAGEPEVPSWITRAASPAS